MNITEQQRIFNEYIDKMREIMFKKGNDYAGEDRLINFKRTGYITGGDASTACLLQIANKVARLTALLEQGKRPENESMEDTVIDLANYTLLFGMTLKERGDV